MDITQVKSPKHYTEGRKFEPKDVIRDWGLNFNLGSALKYIARAGRKDDIVQDLRKAQEYIEFEIQAIEAERKAQEPKKPFVKPECKELCHIVARVPDGVDLDEFVEYFKAIAGI